MRKKLEITERELTRAEYQRLLDAVQARGDIRLLLLLETLCATGIRVSELQYITVEAAKVARSKVFPHNVRGLFARTFYAACRDVVRLADVLGHSSIEMTRIYLLSTAKESARQLDRLGLLSGWA